MVKQEKAKKLISGFVYRQLALFFAFAGWVILPSFGATGAHLGSLSRTFIKPQILSPSVQTGQEFYVSREGNKNNPGTKEAPFSTVEEARDAIRELNRQGGLPAQGVTVWIRGGEYPIQHTLAFSFLDSGTKEKPISYRAYPREQVRLVAGTAVEARHWKILGAAARKRVHPKADAAQLRELDVAALKLRHTKQFAPADRFTDQWYIIDLFANDQRQPLSQWPNPEQKVGPQNEPGGVTCNGSKDNRTFYFADKGQPQNQDGTNQVDLDGTGRSRRWAAALAAGHEVWLKGLWRTPWEPITMRVETINTDDCFIRFREEPPGGMGSKYSAEASKNPLWRVGNGQENWMALNLLEEIDQPGEWALDIKDQKIYYLPPQPLENLDLMIADFKEPLISFDKAAHVQLIGLRLEGGLGDGIAIKDSENLFVAGCTLTNLGGSGINLTGGSGNMIQSNDLYELGGFGVNLRDLGNRKQLISSDTHVLNNHIHHVGRLAFQEAIRIENGVGVTVAHNLMHDLPKGAVRTNLTNDCLFEYNEIHNIALKESDTGTFYLYGGWSTYGNVFRYNFTHHTNRANGFYADDGDSGNIVYRNLVHGALSAIKFGGGHNNLAFENLFVENKAQEIDDRGASRNYRIGTMHEKRLQQMNPTVEPWKSYGQKLQKEYNFTNNLWIDVLRAEWQPEHPNGSALQNNVAVASGPFKKPKLGKVLVQDNLEVKTIREAQFYDFAKLDFRTRNPQVLQKFPDLNEQFLRMGLQKDVYRTQLPTRAETGGLSNRGQTGALAHEDQVRD